MDPCQNCTGIAGIIVKSNHRQVQQIHHQPSDRHVKAAHEHRDDDGIVQAFAFHFVHTQRLYAQQPWA